MNATALLGDTGSPSNPRRENLSLSFPCPAVFAAGLVLAALLPAASHVSAQEQESVAARIARENLATVVTLIAVDEHDQPLALGSGFFVSRDGVLVTNAHVVGGAARVFVRWRGQSGAAVKILNFTKKFDLVMLQTSFATTPAALLADSDSVTIGQDVIVLGSPQGLEGTVSTGIVGGVRTLGGVKFLQITAPISPGSSGGPVFNSQGRVIGIAAAKSAALDLRESDRLKDLVYFNNIIEEFGFFAEGSTLASLTASLQNRTSDTIADVRVLVVVKSPRGEVLDFHLRDFKGTVIPPGLAKQVSIPISTRGL